MIAMTSRQRIGVVSDLIGAVAVLDLPRETIGELTGMLQEYAVAVDVGCDGEALAEMHDALDDAVADALTMTGDRDDIDILLSVRDITGMLWDAVPRSGGGPVAVVVRAVARQFAIMVWADRIRRLPPNRFRDLCARTLDAAHVLFGNHDGGPECTAVAQAYTT